MDSTAISSGMMWHFQHSFSSPGLLQASLAQPHECDDVKPRLDPCPCCHLVHLPAAAAASGDLAAVKEAEGGSAGQSATAHRDFLPNGVVISPAGNPPENSQELEV